MGINFLIDEWYGCYVFKNKKWKSLSDSFRIYKNKQNQPSGSAGTSRKNSWVHYDRMQFLCDDQFENETASNILDQNEEPDQYNDETSHDENSSSDRGSPSAG